MAREMITEHQVERPEIELEFAGQVKPPQVIAGVERVLGDQADIIVVEQIGILMSQAECGGWLGADDFVTLAHRLSQNADIAGGLLAGPLDVAERNASHARAALIGMDVNSYVVVLKDSDQRLGQLDVEPIRVKIDKIQDFSASTPCGTR